MKEVGGFLKGIDVACRDLFESFVDLRFWVVLGLVLTLVVVGALVEISLEKDEGRKSQD